MSEHNWSPADCHAVAIGILQSLQMLAEEADNLRLSRTYVALRKAIRACRIEQARVSTPIKPVRVRRHQVLH